MNGWALGGLLCILYMLGVGGLAVKKAPILVKLVKRRLGAQTADQTALTLSLILAATVGAVGIVLFAVGLGI